LQIWVHKTKGTMIIIKTKTGQALVNDKEIISVSHNREAHIAYVSKPNMGTLSMLARKPIEHVESVNYINDQTGKEWKDNGSEVLYLRKQIESLKQELSYQSEITKRIKERLRQLGHECVQWVQYYHKDMPDEVCKQMRNRGEEEKAYVNNDEDLMYRREWMPQHQKPEQIEADEVARLNAQIEDQDAKIRELTLERDHLKAQQKFNESVCDPTKDVKPSWWQRFLSLFN